MLNTTIRHTETRNAIARAFLKNLTTLLRDEATSGLDAESEPVVQGALNNIMKNKTAIVVVHRLSSVKNADTISMLYCRQVEQGNLYFFINFCRSYCNDPARVKFHTSATIIKASYNWCLRKSITF
jgi:ATP-binding cassette subfamily B (MDR/TAP) protein 1